MRMLLVAGMAVALAGCLMSRMPDVEAKVEAPSLARARRMNLFTVSLYGKDGEAFSPILDAKLRQRLGGILDPGAYWTLTLVDLRFVRPNFRQESPYYQLALQVQLTDTEGRRAWPAIIKTEKVAAKSWYDEERIREHLAEAAVNALVAELPLGQLSLPE
jgi:hypothetical protein